MPRAQRAGSWTLPQATRVVLACVSRDQCGVKHSANVMLLRPPKTFLRSRYHYCYYLVHKDEDTETLGVTWVEG